MSVNEKQIISHIKTLSSLRPDSDWKTKNRELLYNQISSTQNANVPAGFSFKYFFNNNIVFQYAQTIPQSTMVAVFIFVFLVSGSVVSLRASENSVPGDSFYIAKIMSEKTQLALTFDEKNKALLGIEFAGNRAEEINQVLAQSQVSEENSEKVEKLVVDFKKEIKVAKSRLEKINQTKTADNKIVPINNDGVKNPDEEILNDDDSLVFSANADKDDVGINIFDPATNKAEDIATPTIMDGKTEEAASGTKAVIVADPREILKKAGDFLNSDDIDSTLSLMDEAGEVMDMVGGGGEVKAGEEASSTEEVK
ncbi:MAG: hypothetical protein US83_C0015G0026 [Candidatus Falkowbacteria bacterium GW2011_GWC2_38_22]|nr:MAG: hypothetical protein US73_C0013G0026 [Candidatus Falkowbacteria bacterium GW2011_GWF2_38_1205]KKQ60618.1 MAG: hypothetical protein US83_C0015G0026 [Candidatus Falkowbacteria bacterium GW2011_GWC2_38_22]KKQ62709.1 MAG: hypothetical protein US84_C0012G0026 [Candidatus Falkowbacteria bacterium GW2011_GWF1_38_22]KKQ64836.1 MAG: hypothetical protein US87_C0012G0026 [Candidatus Falkowbacteria bacterium GW2011_GWE2_38_254]KKQ72078.1 MAG: hypothetical protein US93_C0012G0026 [Candidatus Falkowb